MGKFFVLFLTIISKFFFVTNRYMKLRQRRRRQKYLKKNFSQTDMMIVFEWIWENEKN